MRNFKIRIAFSTITLVSIFASGDARAQFIIGDVINMTVTRVIKAIDLKVQRMQNKTIWLQNAQKALENEMAKAKLGEISGWADRQKNLYSDYYSELSQIKATIASYGRVKDMVLKQTALVSEYKKAWGLFRQDCHFNAQELAYMQQVYAGILDASVKDLDEMMLAISPAKARMTDEQRLELIEKASGHLDGNYNDLHRFNEQGIKLSLGRSKDLNEISLVRRMYGIN